MDKIPHDHKKMVTGQGDQPSKKSQRKVYRSEHFTKKPNKDSTNPDIEDLSEHFRQLHVQSTAPDTSGINIYYKDKPLSIGEAAMNSIINMVDIQQTTRLRTEAFQQQEPNPRKRQISSESEDEHETPETPETSKRQKQGESDSMDVD